MNELKIRVKNKSGESRAYFLFYEPPIPDSGPEVFQNAYASAPAVPSGNGTATFRISRDIFAVCGTHPGPKIGAKSIIGTEDWGIAKIKQGDKFGSSFTMTGSPGNAAAFDPRLLTQDCERAGCFSIKCIDFKFGNGANQFIGLGAEDPNDPSNIVPVATFVCGPNEIYIIQPKEKYYISWGSYIAGQIVDVNATANPCFVDFEGKDATLAKVEHNFDGTFAVTFN